MQIPGHLAVAIAQYRLVSGHELDQEMVKPLLIASLFPDLVDKSIGYVFHVMPNGRHYAHNLFSLILFSTVVALIWGRAAGQAWFIGYLGHLLADTVGNGFVPWFFPVKKYHFRPGRLSFKPTELLKETILLALVLIIDRTTRLPERN